MRKMITGFAAMLSVGLAVPAYAVADAVNDFLPTHIGFNAPDLDVTQAIVLNLGLVLAFGSIQAGDVGATAGASYVWGVDRGAGVAGLFAGTPSVGPGVTFDAVVVLRPDGTATVSAFNAGAPPTVTVLNDAAFAVDDFIGAVIPIGLLPSRGFATAGYRYNLWTRSGGGNVGIADLAQAEGTFAAVPEPGTWALMVLGFGLVGATARRRAPRLVSQ